AHQRRHVSADVGPGLLRSAQAGGLAGALAGGAGRRMRAAGLRGLLSGLLVQFGVLGQVGTLLAGLLRRGGSCLVRRLLALRLLTLRLLTLGLLTLGLLRRSLLLSRGRLGASAGAADNGQIAAHLDGLVLLSQDLGQRAG